MVYFAQPSTGGPIKIGFTENIKERHAYLESYYGTKLKILKTVNGGREEEKAIHELFSHLRMGSTEQFRAEPELVEFIGSGIVDHESKFVDPMKKAGKCKISLYLDTNLIDDLWHVRAETKKSVSALIEHNLRECEQWRRIEKRENGESARKEE